MQTTDPGIDGQRKGWLAVTVLVAALAVAAVGCGGDDDDSGDQAEAGKTKQVKILASYQESNVWAPMLVGRDAGYFKDEGLEAEIQGSDGSGFVTQQVIAGNKDYGWAVADSIIIAASKQPETRAVACNTQRNIFQILTPEDSDVKSLEDLEGKTLGFTTKGGGEEPMVQSALADAGLEGEVELLPIGEAGPQVERALEGGQVAAYASNYLDAAALKAAGLKLRDITPEKFARVPGDCLMVLKSTLEDKSKREEVIKVGRAWAKGAVFAIANPQAAYDIGCADVPEECEDEAFAKDFIGTTVELLKPSPGIPVAGVDPEGWETVGQILKESGTLKSDVDIDEIINSPDAKDVASEIQDFPTELVEQDAKEYK